MQLYRLTNTDVVELQTKYAELEKKVALYQSILGSEDILNKVIKRELSNIKNEYNTPRLTKIVDEITEIIIDVKKMIAKENVIVVITDEGYVKRVSSKSYALSNDEAPTLKPGDIVTGLYEVSTLDNILLFTNLGRYLFVPVHTIFNAKWKEIGKHISNLIMIAPTEKIIGSLVIDDPTKEITLFTKNGLTKRCLIADFIVTRFTKPMTAIKLKENDELLSVQEAKKNHYL